MMPATFTLQLKVVVHDDTRIEVAHRAMEAAVRDSVDAVDDFDFHISVDERLYTHCVDCPSGWAEPNEIQCNTCRGAL
jgi:hypothetical protein